MRAIKPVKISKGSFAFCRSGIALMVWLSLLLDSLLILGFACLLLVVSAIVKVKRSPLVRVYQMTLAKYINDEPLYVDENGIHFAHVFGSIVLLLAFVGMMFSVPYYKVFLFAVCLLKTSGAFGYCSALKLYSCMSSDNCCRVSKAILRRKSNVR
jgi:hypothetical protein